MQSVTILGSTGSIGQSTLDVLGRHPGRFKVFALTANRQVKRILAQCVQYQPQFVVLKDREAARELGTQLRSMGVSTKVLSGDSGLIEVAAHPEVTTVMAAIVGAAGLSPTLAAVNAGKRVLLANKEALVMAGSLFMAAVAESGAELLPIDSEHNAIFQCLPSDYQSMESAGCKKILLTGSGGPFRTLPQESLCNVTPEEACAHPNWSMGRKISVDSATMMNKGLELIEACWLFDVQPSQIQVVVHPQSVIHSMVEYTDGSVLAQMGNPDMRTPIAHALAWPERIDAGVASLDLIMTARLDFEAPDFNRFPCLQLAIDAAKHGGTAPALLNAANEVAVEAFLQNKIRFIDIASVIDKVLNTIDVAEPTNLGVVQKADRDARACALSMIETDYVH